MRLMARLLIQLRSIRRTELETKTDEATSGTEKEITGNDTGDRRPGKCQFQGIGRLFKYTEF